jgi:APA family basic amino acid/polyamine antiporter
MAEPKPPVADQNLPTALFQRNATGLVREIGALDSFVFNFLSMNLFGFFVLMIFGLGLYPQANLAISIMLASFLALFIALLYVLLSIAMPRTGGDYVWVSRILHPAVGFMVSFGLTFVLFTFIAIDVTLFIQAGIGAYLADMGAVLGNQDMLNLASFLNSPAGNPVVFAFGLIVILAIAVSVYFGARVTFLAQKLVWAFIIAAGLSYFAALLSTSHASFLTNFNQNSGTTADIIINTAKTNGYDPITTFKGTLFGIVFMFLNFTGFSFSAYLSGEIRNVRKTQIAAILGSLLLFAVFLVAFLLVTQSILGYDLIGGLSYLFDSVAFGTNPTVQPPLPVPPFLQFLIPYVTNNPIIIFLVTIGFGLSMLINVVPYTYVSVRNIFAWAFDRTIPASLAVVDERTHSPHLAIIVVTVASAIITYASIYYNISLLFTYITFLFAVLYAIVGLSGLLFPYRRKDLFESSPDIVKKRLFGSPVISIIGAISLVASVFVGYSLLNPEFSGPFILQNFLIVVGVLTTPLLIYAITYTYYKSKGIPVYLAQKQLPPE